MKGIRRAFGKLTRGHLMDRVRTSAPTLFLTFDDGPHPLHTKPLLSVLAQHGANGTFFLVGKSVEAYPEIVRSIVNEGHCVANHSYSHTKREKLTYFEQRADVRRTDAILNRFDGLRSHLFRPPWGDVSAVQFIRCMLGFERVVLWSRDSMDYKANAASIVEEFRKFPPVAGDIILFHDDSPTSHLVLTELLPEWRQRGFQFCSLQAWQASSTPMSI